MSMGLLKDPPRKGEKLALNSSGTLAAITDSLGRILLLDTQALVVVRLWKGYCKASCLFMEALINKDKASTSSNYHEHRKNDHSLCLAIHAPRKEIIEKGGSWSEEIQARYCNKCSSTYAAQSFMGAQRQSSQKGVIFLTVITDLNSCHRTWFHSGVTMCFCPSEEVAKRALLDGLEPSQIRVFGLPIRPSFCRAVLSKDYLRQELEMAPCLPTVLLMGGGEGMGPVKETAEALKEALNDKVLDKPNGQVVIIRGQAIRCKVLVKVRGFEMQMEKWMGACDCIIIKAGPGTISESPIIGLPIILNDFIPRQEVGNIPSIGTS